MAKPASEKVPKQMQAKFEQITNLTDAFCYSRQRNTTVMAKVPVSFVEETLWPEYLELDQTLHAYLEEVTERVISEGIYQDFEEAEVRQKLLEGDG